MRAIFISYRREDAEGQAGRLFDDLVLLFGDQSVFMDVVGIEPGRDFRRAIDEHVASCGVLLAVIGKGWLKIKDASGRRRLDDPMDFVRLETASALKRDIPVIPVLVGDASMPHAEDLPHDLRELAYRNGVELTHPRWDSDVKLLAKALTPYVQVKPKPTASRPPVAPSRLKPVAIALTLIMIAILGSSLLLPKLVVYLGRQNTSEEVTHPAPPREQPNSGPAVNDEKAEEKNAANQDANATETPDATQVEKELSFEDWSGPWELSWEFSEGQWLGPIPMELKSDQSGISGDYGLGSIEGVFVNGDFSKAEGEYTDKTEDEPCPYGESGGPFSLTLAKDGSSMEGLWCACREVATRHWKATRLNSE